MHFITDSIIFEIIQSVLMQLSVRTKFLFQLKKVFSEVLKTICKYKTYLVSVCAWYLLSFTLTDFHVFQTQL